MPHVPRLKPLWSSRCSRGARSVAVALAALGLSAPVADARWSAPSVLVSGDDAGLLGTTVRSDGSLRAAIADGPRSIALGLVDITSPPRFSDPLIVLRSPVQTSGVVLAADGSGVALTLKSGKGSSSLVPFNAGGTAGPPVATDDIGSFSAIATSPAGSAVAAWVRKSAAGLEVVAAFRAAGSGTFGAPVRAGYTTSADTLVQAGIGDRGEAVVTWQPNGFPSAVAAAVRLPGAGFSKATYVTRQGSLVQLAVGPGGQAILAASTDRRMRVSVKRPGAATMPPVRTVDKAGAGSESSVAAGGDRQVAATWNASRTQRSDQRVRVYAGVTATGVHRIGTVGKNAQDALVAVGSNGDVAVGWSIDLPALRGDPTARSRFAVSYRRAGKRFETPVLRGPVALSSTPESLQVVPGGRAYALYEAYESGDDRTRPAFRRVYLSERTP